MSQLLPTQDPQSRAQALEAAHEALQRNECIVLPTDTVYGIGADAFSAQAVTILLAAKGRNRTMPPPVLISRTEVMDALAVEIPDAARELAEAFWPGALTLILPSQPSLSWDLGETQGTVALRIPADDLTLDLLECTGPLAVSSANRTGLAAATSAEQARSMLGDAVSVYIDDGERASQQASTIVDCTQAPPRVVREGAISLEELRTTVAQVQPPAS